MTLKIPETKTNFLPVAVPMLGITGADWWGGFVDATCLSIASLAKQIRIKLKYPHVPFVFPVRV